MSPGCGCAPPAQWNRRNVLSALASAAIGTVLLSSACSRGGQQPPAPGPQDTPLRKPNTVFANVRVLDVRQGRLGDPTDVLVRGNTIAAVGTGQPVDAQTEVVDGRGRTLMPGLIDNHVHLMFGSTTQQALNDAAHDAQFYARGALASAEAMLLRGFTAVRDAGGPIFPLKAAIDKGQANGPRVWPSGAMISQTGGHGDFRSPDEPSRRFTGKPSRAEQLGATFIADGRDEVLTASRENLRMGASQLKLCAGGGTTSAYDPIDVTQYTVDEMRAAVDAASDWNTYVTVHAYTPKSVRRAVDAGVTCVEHGQLLDEPTLELLAQRNIWLSGQYLIPNNENMTVDRQIKRQAIVEGNQHVWPWAKRAGVKLAWGTDFLFEPDLNAQQNKMLLSLRDWFSPAELLRLVTYDNAQLLGLSGPRSAYRGTLGVAEPHALADLIVVNGNPLTNIGLIAEPDKNIGVVMKDGVLYKNA